MIKFSEVSKVYQAGGSNYAALKHASFSIADGEFVSILGPSGSGKSTLMHLLGGLDRPSSGTVEINGKILGRENDEGLAHFRNKEIGFVFQFFNLLPYASALQNVMLPLIYGGQKNGRALKAAQLLHKVGLGNKVFRRPTQLSGGEQQRVAIARALVNDPSIILADEPTGNLDSKTGAAIIDLLISFHAQGKTLIVVTHDESLARRAARILRIRDGEIQDSTDSF